MQLNVLTCPSTHHIGSLTEPPESAGYEEPFSPPFTRSEREGFLDIEHGEDATEGVFGLQMAEEAKDVVAEAVEETVDDFFEGELSARPSFESELHN